MRSRLPLFPLNAVLFPGQTLPLHVFEDRYRTLVRDLLALPEGTPRRFGVVCIRAGREVGADGIRAMYDVGCATEVHDVTAYDDGRFDLVTTGAARFRLRQLDRSAPYLSADVDLLPDDPDPGDEAAVLTASVTAVFTAYVRALGRAQRAEIVPPELPADPLALSYLVAAGALLDTWQRQELLAAADVTTRLRAELALLKRETTMLSALAAVPALDLTRAPVFPN